MYCDFWESVGDKITFKAFAKKGEIEFTLSQILPKDVAYKVVFRSCDNTVTVDFSKKSQEDKRDLVNKVFSRLDACIYSVEDITLGEHCVKLLTFTAKKVGIAESLTGGMVADALISVKGASDVVNESLVCYTNTAKMRNLGVSEATLAHHTAVSGETAYEMINGILCREYNDYALATTGYAENWGGENGGTVYVAVGDRSRIDVHKYSFTGDRQEVRRCATSAVLFHLAKKLKGSFN